MVRRLVATCVFLALLGAASAGDDHSPVGGEGQPPSARNGKTPSEPAAGLGILWHERLEPILQASVIAPAETPAVMAPMASTIQETETTVATFDDTGPWSICHGPPRGVFATIDLQVLRPSI